MLFAIPNPIAASVWQLLRTDGGWWRVSAIRQHFTPQFAEFEVQRALNTLVAHGFAVSREQGIFRLYAFTSECKVLPNPPINPQPGALG